MKLLLLITVFNGMATAVPVQDKLDVRAVVTSKSLVGGLTGGLGAGLGGVVSGLGLVGSSAALLPVVKSVLTPILGAGSSAKASSLPTPTVGIITAVQTGFPNYPTALPSTFAAPLQGAGKLALNNLPALPPVLDKTVSGVLGAVYALMSGVCNTQHMCTITVAGSIQSLLVDGSNYTTNTTISAWCDNGHCYGSANPTATATAPFIITCDQLSKSKACSATISGIVTAIFSNGKELEAWGWLTPSGYCQNGVCTGSITVYGDPMY